MKDWTTLTGVPAEEISARLSALFEPAAYKGIPGGADLTDINTGYMIERLIEVFGIKGLGWNLVYDPADLIIEGEGNRPMARLTHATFQYLLVKGDQERWCEVPTSGSSRNQIEYAPEGARTSAVGAAIKWLGFQVDVYKNKVNHHNIGKTATSNDKSDKSLEALIKYGIEKGLKDEDEVKEFLKGKGFKGYKEEMHDAMAKAISDIELPE